MGASLEDKSPGKMIRAEQKASPIANWLEVDMEEGKRQAVVELVDTCLVSLKQHHVLALLGDEIYMLIQICNGQF